MVPLDDSLGSFPSTDQHCETYAFKSHLVPACSETKFRLTDSGLETGRDILMSEYTVNLLFDCCMTR